MTVALASIPSSVAFAAIAGVSPLVGVWSSVVLGLAAPLLGSRPGVISGAAGVVAVPLGPLVAAQGPAVITLVTLLAAIIEALFGLLKLGKLVNLVSPTVMSGFLNGAPTAGGARGGEPCRPGAGRRAVGRVRAAACRACHAQRARARARASLPPPHVPLVCFVVFPRRKN